MAQTGGGAGAGYNPTLYNYRSDRIRDSYANGGLGKIDFGDAFGGAGGNEINRPATTGGGGDQAPAGGYGGIRAVKDAPKGVF